MSGIHPVKTKKRSASTLLATLLGESVSPTFDPTTVAESFNKLAMQQIEQ